MPLRPRARLAAAPLKRRAPSLRRRGFSLVESLVASVIVSVAAVGVAKGINAMQNANNRANRALERAHVARVLRESFRAIPFASLDNGTYPYFVNKAGQRVSPYAALYRAEVVVTEPPGGGGGPTQRKLVSVTVVPNGMYRPALGQ